MRKTVAVADLQFGMYVAELDRPWTDTPFKFQGFVLKTPEQLEILNKFCKSVQVDPDRAEIIAALRSPTPGVVRTADGRTKYTEVAPVEIEYATASAKHARGTATMRDALVALRAGRTLDAGMVSEAVNGITESVMRNADAMLLFTQLQSKDDYTQSHALDVSVYMTAFGRFLEMPPEDIRLLGHLGLLQDMGKVRLPDPLIQKRERLTPAEFDLAKTHVRHSAEILAATKGLPPELAELATLHHERHDGSGYPRGLKGKDIGPAGSIAGIVDVFDALTARRPYGEPLAPSTALSMIYKWRGTLFDGPLVEQFIRFVGIFPLGSVVELNSAEIAIVIAQNLEKRLQPRIMIIRDAAGNPMKPQKLMDLSRGHKTASGEPYRIKRTLEYGRIPVQAENLFA